jgi:hypothetical protein
LGVKGPRRSSKAVTAMRLIRVKWGKFLLQLPGEIALFWLFKVLLLIHRLNE